MNILWLGINDEGGCTLHWHKMREALARDHDVTLAGPGYTYGDGAKKISQILSGFPCREWDWIVMDDCNAKGYVPVSFDVKPCKVAWREHDYWNRHRHGLARVSDLILGCYPSSPFADSEKWVHIPHAVDTETFFSGNGSRKHPIGMYGKCGTCYDNRTAAKKMIRTIPGAWLGHHGGYWKNGAKPNDGKKYFYNEKLAAALREVGALWVDSPDNKQALVLKYFEGAACGCVLLGEVPAGDGMFPKQFMVECAPEEIPDALNSMPKELGSQAAEHVHEHHSVGVRAGQIMEVLNV